VCWVVLGEDVGRRSTTGNFVEFNTRFGDGAGEGLFEREAVRFIGFML